jgi:adenylylsulfate kinase-like enzyme
MTGVGQDYEIPTQPDLVLDGNGELDAAVDEQVKVVHGE